MRPVRWVIHVTESCPHLRWPVGKLRLLLLQYPFTQDDETIWGEIDRLYRLPANKLSELEAFLLRTYHKLYMWRTGATPVQRVVELIDDNLSRFAKLAGPGGPATAELLGMAARYYALSGNARLAEERLGRFDERLKVLCGEGHPTVVEQVIRHLVSAQVYYSTRGAQEALQEARSAYDLFPAARYASGCLQEVIVTNLALMHAATGNTGQAKRLMLDSGLPLEQMMRFWSDPQARDDALRWYGYKL